MKRLGFLLIALLASPLASGQSVPKGKVTQVFRDQQRVVVTFEKADQIAANDRIIVTSADGEACEGEVLEKTDAKALVDLQDCSSFKEIKSGASASKSEFSQISRPKKTTDVITKPALANAPLKEPSTDKSFDPSRRFRFGLGLYYSAGKTLEFEEAEVTVGSVSDSGKISYELENAFGVTVEGIFSPRNSWGFSAGLSTETKRKFKKAKIEENGQTTESDFVGDAHLTYTHIYANAIYRWDQWYLPFGLNFASVSKDDAPMVFKNMDGRAGIQFGVGFYANENVALEFMFRGSQIHLGGVSDASDYYTLNEGWLFTGNFGAKYVF